jgi:hypothetical protein
MSVSKKVRREHVLHNLNRYQDALLNELSKHVFDEKYLSFLKFAIDDCKIKLEQIDNLWTRGN